jgi:tRNA pseudouridine55 synthase
MPANDGGRRPRRGRRDAEGVPSGILNINKPRGMSSFAVISLVRRLTGVRRVGHAGTLDPNAEGVLPVCVGQATRVVEHIVDSPKIYRGVVRLGVTTDTFDGEGAVVRTGDASAVTGEQIESTLDDFVGEIMQVPPMYSAIKHKGQPLYRYAREGRDVEREPRPVRVYWVRLLSFESPDAEIELSCGRGAYVRSLAHDLGELLGCGGYLESLTRTASGPFAIEDAVAPDELIAAAGASRWEELLHPVDAVLTSWHAAILAEGHSRDVAQGRTLILTPVRVELRDLASETPCRAYSTEGDFLGILRYQGADRWHPATVLAG